MQLRFLDLIKCPYCGSSFKVGDARQGKGGQLINGYVRCECNEFPVLEGILKLSDRHSNTHLVELVKKGRAKSALALSFWETGNRTIAPFFRTKKRATEPLLTLAVLRAKYGYRRYLNDKATFLGLFGKTSRQNYLRHRFSSETLWLVYPFIPLLKSRTRILDLGCGTGQASFIISSYAKPKDLICADQSFRSLYVAKKYFVRNAEFIALDANYKLPFNGNLFDCIFMLDTFHYVQAQALLATEMERILSPEGLLLLLHLHNSLNYNPSAGQPLSPSDWVDLFHQLPIKAFPEEKLIKDFILKGRLDLARGFRQPELNASRAFCLIGTSNDSIFKTYDEVQSALLSNKDNLIINPIYKIRRQNDSLLLQRRSLSKSFRQEFPLSVEYLPQQYIISGKLAKIMKGDILASNELLDDDLPSIEDLMSKFILINVPPNYC
ncbi:MAG: class I SAM-dependent methyltransferase [Dehalococcoidales bacterium]|nr:class I SAM-dependent methyltransferase [Dehalococcoidales bacterium]